MQFHLLINHVFIFTILFLLFNRNKPELENPYMFSNIEVDKTAMEVQESHTINPRRQIDGPQMNEMTQNSVNQTNNSNSVKNGVITVSITFLLIFSSIISIFIDF
jgi:hypothetical protein